MRLLYEIAFFIFTLFYLPFFFIKGKHKDGWLSRLGVVPEETKRNLAGKRVFWVHAVSVGEVVQAARLVAALRERYPDARFVLTTTTVTGQEIAKKLKGDDDRVLYFPIDLRVCVRSFINGIAPAAFVVLETEIWPNVVFELTDRGIPVFLVNARISDKAIGKYRKVKRFLKPLLNRFTAIGAQDAVAGARFIELGARPALVSVTGNMKYDWQPQHSQDETAEKVKAWRRGHNSFLCVAGSTHEGEEEIFFEIYPSLKSKMPAFKLLIAPRHPDRIESIESQAKKKGIMLTRVSRLTTHDSRLPAGVLVAGATSHDPILILDRMGVLAGLYPAADVVFVGGSLAAFGGHNLAEPAFFERPILFGPHMQNFKEMAAEFKKANAAVEVKDPSELEESLLALAGDPERRRALGGSAKRLVIRHQGATERNVELLSQVTREAVEV